MLLFSSISYTCMDWTWFSSNNRKVRPKCTFPWSHCGLFYAIIDFIKADVVFSLYPLTPPKADLFNASTRHVLKHEQPETGLQWDCSYIKKDQQ